MKYLAVIFLVITSGVATHAQTETLTNQTIVELSRFGLAALRG